MSKPTGIHQAIGALASMASRDFECRSDDWERACGFLSVLAEALSEEDQESLHDLVFSTPATSPIDERSTNAWMTAMEMSYDWVHVHRDVVEVDAERGCEASQEMLAAMDENEQADTDRQFSLIVGGLEEDE